MARRPKHTVDYFSHDADASETSRTINILENNFGPDGYCVWFKLLERLSKTNNHFITCSNSEDKEFLAAKFRLNPEKMTSILDKLAELGAIDRELYRYGVIWCQNLVDRFKDVYDNRRQPLPKKPQIDISTGNLLLKTELSTVETKLSGVEMQQSKVNKSKVNNLKDW